MWVLSSSEDLGAGKKCAPKKQPLAMSSSTQADSFFKRHLWTRQCVRLQVAAADYWLYRNIASNNYF